MRMTPRASMVAIGASFGSEQFDRASLEHERFRFRLLHATLFASRLGHTAVAALTARPGKAYLSAHVVALWASLACRLHCPCLPKYAPRPASGALRLHEINWIKIRTRTHQRRGERPKRIGADGRLQKRDLRTGDLGTH